jgi:hypothetical protein
MRDEGSYEAMAEADLQAIKALAVVNCELCDDSGYTGSRRICDHRVHSSADARERAKALVAETLQAQKLARQAARDDREADA